MDENLAAQAELALELQGNYDSLFYEGQWHTNGQLAERAARLAAGFADLGVRPGDRLLVLMANCPEVLITYTAAWRAGAVVTPLIFLVSEDELRHALIDSGAVGVITTVEFVPKVIAALKRDGPGGTGGGSPPYTKEAGGAPGVRFVVVPGGSTETAARGVRLLDFAEVASAEPRPITSRSGTDLAALLYTGGTTGRSKGVPLTHANLRWCGRAAHESSVRAHVMSSILPLPLAHAYGLLVLCGSMHRTDQAKTILMRWFDPAGWVKLAEQHRVQGSSLVPSMIQMLLTQPLEEADLSELITISSGAAPLAADVRREFEARVPNATVYEGYGCTEAATFISANPFGARRAGSVGLPVPGCEVSIQDDAGQVLPPETDGEICVRSPGVMTGYWHTQDSATTVLADGWLHTGDIGHLDSGGYLYVVDRKKDLILRGGFNVYPRDVEDVLVAHPAVAQAGVVGRPDARLGEEIVAFVSLRPGADATVSALTEHAKAHLAANKYPRQITIVPAVPLTSVGKLDRKKLRQWAADAGSSPPVKALAADGREDMAGDLAESDPGAAGARGGGGDRHLVGVQQEGSDRSVGQGDRFGAAPAQFEQAAALAAVRAADGS
jgi:long-chain acyl-CoA synthetase